MEFGPSFFYGGLHCLDYANTFDHLRTPPAYDHFPDRATIIKWGKAAGILNSEVSVVGGTEDQGYIAAMEVRSLLFRLFSPFTQEETPTQADLAGFNELLQKTSAHLEIFATPTGYTLGCVAEDPLNRILSDVVRSASNLLLSNKIGRVRACPECGWMFFDTTRNGSRRWCDMKFCGNKAKARRHYERVKEERAASV